MLPLSLLFTVRGGTNSFSWGSAAIAVYGLTTISLPVKARLLDAHGERLLIPAMACGSSAALALLVVEAWHFTNPSPYVFLALTALTGLVAPPLGPTMRATWSRLTAPKPELRVTAMALDSACEEALYLLGPVLVGTILFVSRALVALLIVVSCLLIGSFGMALHGAVESPDLSGTLGKKLEAGRRPKFIRIHEMRLVMLVMFLFAGSVNLIYISVAGIATVAGSAGAAGLVEAAIGIGSVLGGIVWGRMNHSRGFGEQYLGLLIILVVGSALAFAVAPNLLLLGLVLGIAGCAVGPLYVVSYVAADTVATDDSRTEAGALVNMANNFGSAAGASVAGIIVDQLAGANGLLVSAGTLTLAASTAGFSYARTHKPRSGRPAAVTGIASKP